LGGTFDEQLFADTPQSMGNQGGRRNGGDPGAEQDLEQ
jgi:hypothetical protein